MNHKRLKEPRHWSTDGNKNLSKGGTNEVYKEDEKRDTEEGTLRLIYI